jgi:hypothetical protein
MIQKGQVARSTPYDNSTSLIASTNVQDAIDELHDSLEGVSKGFVFCQYNGNANVGRYLEFFAGIDSNIAPIYSTTALNVIEIVSATTSTSATCTIGFYDNTTLLYTVTFSAVKQVISTGTPASPLFTLPANGSLKVKIDSGSINRPHIYFIAQGGQ